MGVVGGKGSLDASTGVAIGDDDDGFEFCAFVGVVDDEVGVSVLVGILMRKVAIFDI